MGAFVTTFLWTLIIVSVLFTVSSIIGLAMGFPLLGSGETALDGVIQIVLGIYLAIVGVGATIYWYQETQESAHGGRGLKNEF